MVAIRRPEVPAYLVLQPQEIPYEDPHSRFMFDKHCAARTRRIDLPPEVGRLTVRPHFDDHAAHQAGPRRHPGRPPARLHLVRVPPATSLASRSGP